MPHALLPPVRRVAAAVAVATVASVGAVAPAPPAAAAATNRTVRVTVYDASGVTQLHQYTATAATENLYRFSVASAGWNDPGSGEGQLSIDDLVVDRANGTQTTMPFTTPPSIVESTTGGTADALRHDTLGGRLLGIGNSGYACTTNYESIDVGGSTPSSVTRVRFKLSRVTGDTGDGSWWEVYAGLTPSDGEQVLNPKCTGLTGTVDNLLGVHVGGDGDTLRREVRGSVDGSEPTSAYTMASGTTYLVDIQLTTTAAVPPGAARSLAAAAGPGAGQIRLTWAAPLSDGGSPVTGYRVYRSTSATGTYAVVGTTGSGPSFVDSGLSANVPYHYRVRAVNAVGEGPDSNTATATTYAAASPPRDLDARPGPTAGRISLTWQPPLDNGGSAVTGYALYRSTTGGGPYTRIASLGTATSYADTGLANGYTAHYRVRAVTTVGEGAQSNEGSATTFGPPYDCGAGGAICTAYANQPPATPAAPSGPASATPGQSQSYTVAATDPDEEPLGDDVVSYTVDWGDGRQASTGYVSSGTPVQLSRAWPVAGTYCVKARASDNRGATTAWSTCRNVTVNASPHAPGTPTGPAAVVPGTSYAYSATATDPDGHAVRYTFDWGDGTTTTTGSVASGTAGTASHSWSAAGSYCVRASAVDSGGLAGPASGCLTVAANTAPAAPPVPSGPASGVRGRAYSYWSTATDPDGDRASLTFDWGDGTQSSTGLSWSGSSMGFQHSWAAAGSYCVKARTTDERGATGPWSACRTVTMSEPNLPPSVPVVSGPTSGSMGTAYTYTATSSDPEGSTLYYSVYFGDSYRDGGPFASGTPIAIDYTWYAPGTYCVQARAFDSANVASAWSECLWVTIVDPNQPPSVPGVPTGPSSGVAGSTLTYTTSATDPEGGQVQYTFDWGDGSAHSTTGLVASGASASRSHSWPVGTYCVRAYATDATGRTSGWSGCRTVSISAGSAPGAPSVPSGPTSARPAIAGTYSTSGTDPDGQSVYYTFDWGDGTLTATGFVASGAAASASHYWNAAGSYCVRSSTTDSSGMTSGWSPCRTVSVARNDCALATDAGNTHATASVVAPAATPCTGTLEPTNGDGADFYRFSASSGQAITVTLAPGQDPCVDYDLYLWDPSGVQKASSTGGSCATDGLTFTADATGAWRVEVRAYSQVTGSYTITYSGPNQAPTACWNHSVNGMTVTTTNCSTDPEGQALTYTWTWGDGSPAQTTTATTVSHAYESRSVATALDVYDIRLTVTDGTTTTAPSLKQVSNVGPTDAALAKAWAPVFYQDTDDSNYTADKITLFNFDGDYRGNNNWENADNVNFDHAGYVYYYVAETESHYHIGYMVFHPKDWADGSNHPDPGQHENDMEGALVLVLKDASSYGKFLAVHTMAHNSFNAYKDYQASPSSGVGLWSGGTMNDVEMWSAPDGTTHPSLGIESKGHGIFHKYHANVWDSGIGDFRGRDGYVYYPKGAAEEPTGGNDRDVSYGLMAIDVLWANRYDICANCMYASYSAFAGGCNPPDVWTCTYDSAHAPWGMDDGDDGATYNGEWFEDPANYNAVWLYGLGTYYSQTYVYRSTGGLAESFHDYPDALTSDWVWQSPGAARVRVRFADIDTEAGYDTIEVVDPASGAVVGTWSGCAAGPRCGLPAVYSNWVQGDTVYVRFRSDATVTDWGFYADRIEAG